MNDRPTITYKPPHLQRAPLYREPQENVPAVAVNQIWKASFPAENPKHYRVEQITDKGVVLSIVYFARGNWCTYRPGRGTGGLLKPRNPARFSGKLEFGNFLYVEG